MKLHRYLKRPDRYLIEFEEGAWAGSFASIDGNATARSFAVFTPQEVGLSAPSSTVDGMKQEISLYPNPAHDQITIAFDQRLSVKIDLIDLHGMVVRSFQTNNDFTLEIDTSDLPSGMYLIKSTNSNGHSQQRRVVKL